jgi:hypothetical protein
MMSLIATSSVFAQDEDTSSGRGVFGIEAEPLVGPLVADRPDFTESAVTVPMGHLQIEMGFTYFDDPDLWTLPEALLRLGVTRDLELRLELPSYFDLDSSGNDDDGLTDMAIGAKWRFNDQDGAIPALAVIPFLTIPTGDDPVGQDDVQVGAVLAGEWALGEELTLSANLGLETFERANGGHTLATTTSVSLGLPIAESTGAFVEYYAFYPGTFDDSEQIVDGGVTHHIHNNLMLDAKVGLGLNSDSPDFLVGAGVTWRY